MAKILTQEEIDALLTTVAKGDSQDSERVYEDEKLRSVIAYDFKHPNRVSKDQIRTLENLHDNFAGHLGSSISSVLRTIADVDLVSVDQITYSEFIMSLVTPSSTYTFSAAPLAGVCLVDLNPTLAFSLIDRIFGGHGKSLETERELTSIERTVMGKLINKLYNDLTQAWENIVKIDIAQVSFETNPQFIQIVPPGETVVVVSFQVKLFQSTGLLTICYPYVSIEPILSKLSAQNWIDATKRKSQGAEREINLRNVLLIPIDVAAQLVRVEVKMSEFMQLQVGDVIRTARPYTHPTDLLINRRRKFVARPGLHGRKRAVQILAEFEEAKEC